nr:uncharacterized protein LOC129262745 [Lytechinus pictus]
MKSFQQHLHSLYTQTNKICEEELKAAGRKVREQVLERNPDADRDGVLDVAVSYDGTWHKRGFTSNHGVGVVISMDTGEVLDREVVSKVCPECQYRNNWDREGDEYKTWWDGHKDGCLGKYKGSSGKMEVEAAQEMWKRSINLHNLRYKYVVCDGDSSTFKNIEDAYFDNKDNPGPKLMKYECVGHVGKRMFKRLDNFRKKSSLCRR